MGKRRQSELELCFDSLTDLVTNLAGGLVLVVPLLMALTHEAPKSTTAAGTSDAVQKSIRPLSIEITHVGQEIDNAEANLALQQQKLQELEAEFQSLKNPSAPASNGNKQDKK